jgi:hypothetical protein
MAKEAEEDAQRGEKQVVIRARSLGPTLGGMQAFRFFARHIFHEGSFCPKCERKERIGCSLILNVSQGRCVTSRLLFKDGSPLFLEQGHETEGDRAMFTFSPAVSDEFTR